MGTSQFQFEMTVGDSGSNVFGFSSTFGALKRIAKQQEAMPAEILIQSDGVVSVKPANGFGAGNHDMVIEFEGYDVSTEPTLGLSDSHGDPIRMRWDITAAAFTVLNHPDGHPRDDFRMWIEALVGKVVRIAITQYDHEA